MLNIGNLFKILFEIYEESSQGRIMIFCLTLTGILFVIDKMLTHTFPALSLIGLIILFGTFAEKTYENHQRNKFFK